MFSVFVMNRGDLAAAVAASRSRYRNTFYGFPVNSSGLLETALRFGRTLLKAGGEPGLLRFEFIH